MLGLNSSYRSKNKIIYLSSQWLSEGVTVNQVSVTTANACEDLQATHDCWEWELTSSRNDPPRWCPVVSGQTWSHRCARNMSHFILKCWALDGDTFSINKKLKYFYQCKNRVHFQKQDMEMCAAISVLFWPPHKREAPAFGNTMNRVFKCTLFSKEQSITWTATANHFLREKASFHLWTVCFHFTAISSNLRNHTAELFIYLCTDIRIIHIPWTFSSQIQYLYSIAGFMVIPRWNCCH